MYGLGLDMRGLGLETCGLGLGKQVFNSSSLLKTQLKAYNSLTYCHTGWPIKTAQLHNTIQYNAIQYL